MQIHVKAPSGLCTPMITFEQGCPDRTFGKASQQMRRMKPCIFAACQIALWRYGFAHFGASLLP